MWSKWKCLQVLHKLIYITDPGLWVDFYDTGNAVKRASKNLIVSYGALSFDINLL